jgi:hypothetical protein
MKIKSIRANLYIFESSLGCKYKKKIKIYLPFDIKLYNLICTFHFTIIEELTGMKHHYEIENRK